jgi:hypothetical protein
MHKVFWAALAVGTFSMVWGDTLALKDGTTYEGTFISGNSSSVTFREDGGVRRRFDIGSVASINFGTSTSLTGTSSTLGRTDNARDRIRSADRARNSADLRTLPAGTDLVIRTNEAIESESAAEGRTYSAQLDKDVTDSTGTVVIPRGSQANLAVTRVDDAGTLNEAELALSIHSVNINGRRYLVNTEPVEQSSREGIGKNRRTAEMVGGGAAIGTVIGAIAGGGRGALIGAIIGAVGGGAAQVLTKGKKVSVPAESVLTFRLDQPVRLEPVG